MGSPATTNGESTKIKFSAGTSKLNINMKPTTFAAACRLNLDSHSLMVCLGRSTPQISNARRAGKPSLLVAPKARRRQMKYGAMRTKPGREEKACIKNAGPERKRRVNNSGYTWGAEANNGYIIDDLGEIKGVRCG